MNRPVRSRMQGGVEAGGWRLDTTGYPIIFLLDEAQKFHGDLF